MIGWLAKISRHSTLVWLPLLLLIGIGHPALALAQTMLSGQVRTAEKQPVPGALVEVQVWHRPESMVVMMTDEAGFFPSGPTPKPTRCA